MTCQPPAQQLHLCQKLLTIGPKALSDVELLSVFISADSQTKPSLAKTQEIIDHFGDIRAVLRADLNCFQRIPELSVVRFVQLQAMQEMCRRSDFISLKQGTKLTSTRQTYAFFKGQLRDNKYETFSALFLSSQHRILAYEVLFTGTIDSATVYTRPIVEKTIKHNAAAIILAHNHPSGHCIASHEDIAATKRIKKALELVDARLLDHLVIGDNEVYSISKAMKLTCH